ncbi:MAG: YchF family ATPase [Anaerolineales bacterium]|nr:YchF family ATPase [Anaerolineales bacterium]
MQLGIIGLQAAGKTTIFNALTGGNLTTGAAAGIGRPEVHTAVSDVPDDRLTPLVAMFQPRKTFHAKVTYADIGGLKADLGREGLPGALINQLAQVDGLLHVVRAFDNPAVPHPLGRIDPEQDFAVLEAELLLTDMLTVERRLQRQEEEHQRGGRDRAAVEREMALFRRLEGHLSQSQPLRSLTLSEEEERTLSGFGMLTRKPMLVVVNVGEGESAPAGMLASHGVGVDVLALQGELEMEIAQLSADERQAFMQEYGIEESGRRRVIRASYALLDQISFFTVGEDEVRAWTLKQGEGALKAAETIHSDLARGFIRAEVIAWDLLVELGGLQAAKQQGKLRLEGKEYLVKDGEVVHIRFNA